MQAESGEVADDESDGVGPRTEAGNVLAVDNDDAGEAEVDGGGKEGGTDGEADEVAVSGSLAIIPKAN